MRQLLLSLLIMSCALQNFSQNTGIGVGTVSPHISAAFEVKDSARGFLPPRMTTTQRDAISTPATGLVIFNTTTNSLEYKSSTGWVLLTASTPIVIPDALPTIQIGT